MAICIVIVVAVIAMSPGGGGPAGTKTAAPPAECAGEEPADVRRRLGQRIVVRMEGEATRALLDQARAGEIGGVVLFPPEGADPGALAAEVGRLQAAAAEAGVPPLLVAIDQEGGEVKRLAALPPDGAPPELAGDEDAAAAEGEATGAALAELGVNVDLAPVLDVPAGEDSFIASRAFGTTPEEVAAAGTAFAEGLAEGGVAATAKHFPGLGHAPANTDLEPSEVAASREELETDLEPFEAAIGAGIELVMLSNATYPALDPATPAFGSSAIADELLRGELGFEGVTITDDLEAGAVRASFDRGDAATTAAAAGTDLLLFALTERPEVLDALVAAADRGAVEPEGTEASCARITSLRRGFED